MQPATAPIGGISVTEDPGRTVVRLRGEVDEALSDQAGAVLARLLERSLPIVLETRAVTFIDSTGLSFLARCGTYGRQRGLRVTLPDPSPRVAEMVAILELEEVFDTDDVEDRTT